MTRMRVGRSGRRPRRLRRAGLAAALASFAGGCADPGASVQQLGLPFTATTWTVQSATARGPYLDVMLARESGVTSRVFTLDTETCRSVLTAGSQIEWKESGPGGTFARGDESCSAAGVSDLANPRRPRPIGQIAPSAFANFTSIHSDEATIFLRGRFPLGSTVGWPVDQDCVAVLPNTPACRSASASGSATLQYWPSKDSVLRLMTPDPQGCPVLALLGPPPREQASRPTMRQAAASRRRAITL